MSIKAATVQGTVNSDGTLDIQDKISLPPGPVQVMIAPVAELPKDDPFWQRMEAIWAGQKARGHVPRGVEEVEAEHRAIRQEWDERMHCLERLQADAKDARKKGSPST